MSKEQKRSNREIRKPKQKKEPLAAPVSAAKVPSASVVMPKKK